MKHIRQNEAMAFCGAVICQGELSVEAAMASDCDECRAKVMVQPVAWSKPKEGEVSVPINITPEPVYMSEPMVNADEIIRLKKEG